MSETNIPKIEKNIEEKDGVLTFTLSGINVSLANAIRRTILSDIPIVGLKTMPYDQNTCNIISNTSRLHNEIIKHRLSCIPVHISDLTIPLKNYLLEVNVENLTDTIIEVTTEHFKIKNLVNGEYLNVKDVREIFPPDDQTGDFIILTRLNPKISNEIPGEKINLNCQFTIVTSKEDFVFNAVSCCSYGFTQDDGPRYEEELMKKRQEWKNQNLSKEDMEYQEKDWKLLDAKRIYKKNSYDFIIETIGIYTNRELVHKACDIINTKLLNLKEQIDTDKIEIKPSINTIKNCYDVELVGINDTIGRIVKDLLYEKFFEELKTMTYCGFKIMHPHDEKSVLRIAYTENIDKHQIKTNIISRVEFAMEIYNLIKKQI
jgi:DNA-directed RNA polymerase subunit L